MPQFAELPLGLQVYRGGKSVIRREREDELFLDIEFPTRVWADTEYCLRYHVYSSPTERVSVEASSVIEALVASGVEAPYKIERGTAVDELRAVVVGAGRLLRDPEEEPEADAEEAVPELEAGEDQPAEEAAADSEQTAEPTAAAAETATDAATDDAATGEESAPDEEA